MDACNIPRVDPALIHRHAYKVKRIVVELVYKLEFSRNMFLARKPCVVASSVDLCDVLG